MMLISNSCCLKRVLCCVGSVEYEVKMSQGGLGAPVGSCTTGALTSEVKGSIIWVFSGFSGFPSLEKFFITVV